jgi:uncharacterized protein (TIGR02145 family)
MEKIIKLLFLLCLNMSVLAQSAGTIKDAEGNEYKTVQIGDQVWMAENLRTSVFGNGDSIPNVKSKEKWVDLTSGAWVYYQNNPNFNPTFGKLYNWYVIEDERGICPAGFHVPTNEEWNALGAFLVDQGYTNEEGVILKAKQGWNDHETLSGNGEDKYQFGALPGGNRNLNGTFSKMGINGYWWSASVNNIVNAWCRYLYNSSSSILCYDDFKNYGFSIRCVQD